MIGLGWGLSATILENKNEQDTSSIEKLANIVSLYPQPFMPAIKVGIKYSFSEGISPVLDKKLIVIINSRFQKK